MPLEQNVRSSKPFKVFPILIFFFPNSILVQNKKFGMKKQLS